ncbi:hypothetical protein [Actinotalea fermentans]|uniref:DUF559 domain-containing protein n=1 Tax=Actinotalea fermentans TaxID=43671 RepID=A0A511Z134_9CELL|nr:hypothetical protein [Actinotalea fermentans]KGM15112.1 hypothetical protein N867_11900 [Actinotalea fermentans ATCC 43279 = JCM 9966 = DSM 3133]GEN81170.1 hypothetical protein AFE02nite_29040 [Actinotalea fermentans]
MRPGAYTDTPVTADPYEAARHTAVARVAAAVLQLETPVVVSHGSAALLWGLPAPTTAPVHLTQTTKPCRNARGLLRHSHRLSDGDSTTLSGIRVTTPARTVLDCAATLPPSLALAVVDAALHAGVDRGVCLELLAGTPRRRGAIQARAVLDLADDGAESPGESRARFALLAAGLPRPETQIAIETHLGTFWSDLGWPAWRLLAEYDGRGKYTAAGSTTEAVLAEKRRQDAIEEAGYRVLRITSEDLRSPARLVDRVIRSAPPTAIPQPLRPRGALAEPPRVRPPWR